MALAKIEAEVGPLHLAASRDGLDGDVLVGPGLRGHRAALPSTPFTDASDLWAAPLNKIYVQHPELSRRRARRGGPPRPRAAWSTVAMAGEGIVELLPLGLSKATGLSLAARRLGVKAADTIAFGDMPNDIPMFAWAAHGVAMANAHQELKAVADEVTSSNEEDGIAVVLERLLA